MNRNRDAFNWFGPRASGEGRRKPGSARKQSGPSVERLESRELLTGISADPWSATASDLYDTQNGPMANMGTTLVSLYQSYNKGVSRLADVGPLSSVTVGAVAKGLAPGFSRIRFQDGLVGLSVKSVGGNFEKFVVQLEAVGMKVTASDAGYDLVEGWVPVDKLPTVAQLPQTLSATPMYAPVTHAFQSYQGVAYNQPATALGAEAVRSEFGLTGAGVTVGVLSDSVSRVGGGLSDSYATGDLNGANPVTVIADAPSGSDEGRAMLEGIHDIAPGANLQFATGGPGELGFMQNIKALHAAGSKVIVDDLSYPTEPMFQDGLIAQGVNFVTARGSTYFSSAGNAGTTGGYLAPFRSASTTVNGSAGVWQDFDPGAGVNALMPVTTLEPNTLIVFQYDQPYRTQQPAGATASVTSVMHYFVYDSGGTVVASGTDNNVATQEPLQAVTVPTPGAYFVAIQLVSGSAPGNLQFMGISGGASIAVSQQYGSAGGTYYPSSYGHEISANTIGVGATPWWAPSPYVGQTPLASEESSSAGPGLITRSPKGTPTVPRLVQNPAITAPDGGTTSFFGEAGIDTRFISPTTPFNYVSENQQTLKSFFGTSQAAPNAAAVAALMLEHVPTLSRAQILSAMTSTARPMNGTPAGTWNSQSGYGLINAVAAVKAVKPTALAASTATLTNSGGTPTVGQPFNLNVNVAGGSGTPTGTVDFYDVTYNTSLGNAPLAGGLVSLPTSPTNAGVHMYFVTYGGDATYAKSSAYLLVNVAAAPNDLGKSFAGEPELKAPVFLPTPTIEGLLSPFDLDAEKRNARARKSTV